MMNHKLHYPLLTLMLLGLTSTAFGGSVKQKENLWKPVQLVSQNNKPALNHNNTIPKTTPAQVKTPNANLSASVQPEPAHFDPIEGAKAAKLASLSGSIPVPIVNLFSKTVVEPISAKLSSIRTASAAAPTTTR